MNERMATVMEVIFWVCCVLVVYVYITYPVLVGLLAWLFPRKTEYQAKSVPSVSLLISAYNEGAVIADKLENSLLLDYDADLLEIIVVSDSSDDNTDEIVRSFADRRVKLIRQSPRKGKSSGLNLAVQEARGQILIFSDANAIYKADAIQQLVHHFSSPSVGYVVGNARYVDKSSPTPSGEAEGLYWKLETWMKKKESIFESVVGGDGAIYAIRHELYSPLRSTDINDFVNPLQIIDDGFRGLFEVGAVSYEDTAESFEKEFRRKVRIVSRSLNALRRVPGVLNPFRNRRHWLLLVSHKLLRWLMPFFLLSILVSSVFLWQSLFFRTVLFLQIVFYVLAGIGLIAPSARAASRVVSLIYYFCLVNLASLIGCLKCFRGDLSATWTPPRQSMQSKV